MNVEYFINASAALSRHVRTDLKFSFYLYGHLNDIEAIDGDGEVHPRGGIVYQLQAGLRYKLILQLSDYVYQSKPSERRIDKLLAFAESNLDRIPWQTVPSRSSLKDQREKLVAVAAQIKNLSYVRNKYFAHIDEEYVVDPDAELGDILPSIDDLYILINTLASILTFIDRHLGRSPEIGYDAWFDNECRQFTEELLHPHR